MSLIKEIFTMKAELPLRGSLSQRLDTDVLMTDPFGEVMLSYLVMPAPAGM